MLVGAPLVETEQDSPIRIEDLSKVIMRRRGSRLTKERLVPCEAARDVVHPYDRPYALHRPLCADDSQPRRAASRAAMSIFVIVIIAAKARFASAPPAASASVSARGVICHERPQRSLHQPHALSCPR